MKIYRKDMSAGTIVLSATLALGLLAGCEKVSLLDTGASQESEKTNDEESLRQDDALLANQENYKINLDISCVVEFFPYRDISEMPGLERIKLERSRSEKTKDGWGPIVISDVKVTSWDKEFEGSLIASSPTYATIAFGGQVVDGATTSLFVVTYMIDLTSLKFKRTVSIFPFGEEKVSKGVCRNSTAS
jgi:hypothetical protein